MDEDDGQDSWRAMETRADVIHALVALVRSAALDRALVAPVDSAAIAPHLEEAAHAVVRGLSNAALELAPLERTPTSQALQLRLREAMDDLDATIRLVQDRALAERLR